MKRERPLTMRAYICTANTCGSRNAKLRGSHEWRRTNRSLLLQCMSPFMALFGHGAMSDLSPLCAPKRTSVDHSEFIGSRPGRRGRRPEGLAPKFLKFRNFACQRTQITSIPITVLPTEGRAHVTNAERDAVDAAASGARKCEPDE